MSITERVGGLLAASLLAALLAGMPACKSGKGAGNHRPSVLLITVDTLRADRLSAYGYTKKRTAGIDSLARDGALFERAFCDIPWTTGSMASVMTGTFSNRHGLHLPSERLGKSHTTLAEILKEAGYRTGAVIGSFPLSAVYGLNQGFDSYDERFSISMWPKESGAVSAEVVPPPPEDADEATITQWADRKMQNDAYRSDADVTDAAIRWLETYSGGQFFLWVHYFGPHERIELGRALGEQWGRMVSDYDGDLQQTDAAVRRLLSRIRELGLVDNLLVVLHSDHGQSLGEHNYVGHGLDLYDGNTRIPLLLRLPGRIPPGKRMTGVVRNVDIMPTILDFAGVPIPAGLDGRSLVPAIAGGSFPAVPAYAETYASAILLHPLTVSGTGTVLAPTVKRSVRTEHWKLIENDISPPCEKGTAVHLRKDIVGIQWVLDDGVALSAEECEKRVDELYDLDADPGELANRVASDPAHRTELAQILREVGAEKGEAEKITLSPEDKERLRSLGYHPGDE